MLQAEEKAHSSWTGRVLVGVSWNNSRKRDEAEYVDGKTVWWAGNLACVLFIQRMSPE